MQQLLEAVESFVFKTGISLLPEAENIALFDI
jgi:hypothetical protein